MNLQSYTINFVNNTVGLNLVLNKLEQLLNRVKPSERHHIENIILYFKLIYKTKVDVERDAIQYKSQALVGVQILNQYLNESYSEPLAVVIHVINHNINHVSKLRKIN